MRHGRPAARSWRVAMSTFAAVALAPDGMIAWGLVGLLAGFFAGVVTDPGRYGVVADTVAALAGAALGGGLFGLLVGGAAGFWGSIAAASLGACASIALLRGATRSATRP